MLQSSPLQFPIYDINGVFVSGVKHPADQVYLCMYGDFMQTALRTELVKQGWEMINQYEHYK